jgi:hypothetical protein
MKLLPALGLTAGLEKITKQADRTRMLSTFPDLLGIVFACSPSNRRSK